MSSSLVSSSQLCSICFSLRFPFFPGSWSSDSVLTKEPWCNTCLNHLELLSSPQCVHEFLFVSTDFFVLCPRYVGNVCVACWKYLVNKQVHEISCAVLVKSHCFASIYLCWMVTERASGLWKKLLYNKTEEMFSCVHQSWIDSRIQMWV